MALRDDAVLKYDKTADKYAVHVQDAKEVIRQTLYDTQTYLAAGQTQLSFFQAPVGQAGKTLQETNMELAGSLPAGKSFLVEGIGIHLVPTAAPVVATATANFINDIQTFAKAGFLKLQISSKDYLVEAPLGVFPPKTGLSVGSAVATTTAATNMFVNYASMAGEIYSLQPANLMIVPTTNFNITLNWPAALPLPSGADMKVIIKLYGVLYRWVQ